jgi:pyridoxal 5'-phosphate synthase pdxS subunit
MIDRNQEITMKRVEFETAKNGIDAATSDATATELKVGLAKMLCGGVILDVTSAAEAKIAEAAGAAAVMALERVPADIRKEGGVARMAAVSRIREIRDAVTIPVMAKARIGHFVEAQVLERLGIDFIDESEVLTPADDQFHIEKHGFKSPFVCGATGLAEALRRIGEGAAMIRTKGEAGTGNIVEAVRHLRKIQKEIRELASAPKEELMTRAKELNAPYDLVKLVAATGRLPVPNFAAGGIATPADAALVMQLGAEAVFVGSGVFKSEDPARTAAAIVKATARHAEPEVVAEACAEAGAPMRGIAMEEIPPSSRLAGRGW